MLKKIKSLLRVSLWQTFKANKSLFNRKVTVYKGGKIKQAGNSKLTIAGRLYLGTSINRFYWYTKTQTVINMFKDTELIINGTVYIGQECKVVLAGGALEIGDRSYISANVKIYSTQKISIGSECAISWDVTIMDNDGHQIGDNATAGAVEIGNHVWIGCNTVILKGTKIGDNCIIGAGSVVKGVFPDRCLIAGNPASIVRENIEDWV